MNLYLQFYLGGLVCSWVKPALMKQKKAKEPYVFLMTFDINYRKSYQNKSRRFGN